MKVLHLISSAGMYGAEVVVATLARELQSMGEDAIVGLFENAHCPKNDAADRMENSGVKIVRITCADRADWRTLRAIREILHANQIQILHTHGYKADIYGYLASRAMGIPVVATRHNNLGAQRTIAIRLYEFLDFKFLRRFTAVTAVSDSIAQELRDRGVSQAKITVISNGVDLSSSVSASCTLSTELNQGRRLLIGTAGRLIPQKGLQYFLRAARKALDEVPDLLFVVVGEGPHRAALEQLSRELGIQENVVFTGLRADMPGVYASLDVFVLPSLEEGMPMTILEAFASGLPVIASQVGAIPKLVVPGETGILIQPGDVEALAVSLLSLARDAELRRRLGRNGAKLVEDHFSSRVMSRNYLRLYSQLGQSFDNTSVPHYGV